MGTADVRIETPLIVTTTGTRALVPRRSLTDRGKPRKVHARLGPRPTSRPSTEMSAIPGTPAVHGFPRPYMDLGGPEPESLLNLAAERADALERLVPLFAGGGGVCFPED